MVAAIRSGKPGADSATDSDLHGDGTIFPTEDATDDTGSESAIDTGSAVDTSGPMVDAKVCGTPGKACCGTSCSVGYCHSGTCFANPTVTEETTEAALCGDLGVTHAKPLGYLERYTIEGRPGALAYRYARKVSCAGSVAMVTPESPLTLDASGSYTLAVDNTASADCASGTIGKYEAWVVVDGIESAHNAVTFFNSKCTTCAAAGSLCP